MWTEAAKAPSNGQPNQQACQVKIQNALNNSLNTQTTYLTPTFTLQGQQPGWRNGAFNFNYFATGLTQGGIMSATNGTGRFSGQYAGLHIPQPGVADPIIAVYGAGELNGQNGFYLTAHYDSSNPFDDLVSLFQHFINDVLLRANNLLENCSDQCDQLHPRILPNYQHNTGCEG